MAQALFVLFAPQLMQGGSVLPSGLTGSYIVALKSGCLMPKAIAFCRRSTDMQGALGALVEKSS